MYEYVHTNVPGERRMRERGQTKDETFKHRGVAHMGGEQSENIRADRSARDALKKVPRAHFQDGVDVVQSVKHPATRDQTG